MFDYRHELETRIEQFAGYLTTMHRRAHEEVEGSCFIIFEERHPEESNECRTLAEAATPAVELAHTAFDDGAIGGINLADDPVFVNLPDEGWKQNDSQNRFVQFSFEEKWFCLDMSRQTLYRAEATQILRSRNGFFYLRDRPEFTLYGEDVDGYDPFRKVYVYGDEQSAAEDMAFIFFQVWKFPVDWRLYVTAAAFGDKASDWEDGAPIE